MKSSFSQKLRRGRMSKKFHLRFRDFFVVDIIKTGPAAGLQTTVKKITPHGAVVQFKYLPKLKKMKYSDGKFSFVLDYKIAQCCYLFEFEPCDQINNISLETADANAVKTVAKLKRLRQQECESGMEALDTLLKAAREGELQKPSRTPSSKEPKVKTKGKQADSVARKSKSETLQEITDLLAEGVEAFCTLTDSHIKNMIKMVFENIHREQGPYPRLPPLRVFAATARVACDEVDVVENCWSHLSQAYTLFIRMIINCSGGQPVTDIPTKHTDTVLAYRQKMKKHLSPKYIRGLFTVLQSGDRLERYHGENVINALWEHCDWCIPTIKKCLIHYIQTFVSTQDDNFSFKPYIAGTSIASIVNILVEHSTQFTEKELLKVSIALYRAPFSCLVYYQPPLLKLTTKAANDNHALAAPILIKLVRLWPRQSANKQLFFIEQIQAIFLALVQKKNGQNLSPHQQWCYSNEDMQALIEIRQPLFTQVCLCLESTHSELAATAVRILDHPGVFFPFILFPKEMKAGVGPVDTDNHTILGIIIHAFDKIGADHAYLDIRKTIETLKRLVMDKHGQDICRRAAMEITNKAHIFNQRNLHYQTMLTPKPCAHRSLGSSMTLDENDGKRDSKRKPTMPLTREQQTGTRKRRDSLGEDDDFDVNSSEITMDTNLALPTTKGGRRHKAASISGGQIDLKMLELIAGLEQEKSDHKKGMERRRSKVLLAVPLLYNDEEDKDDPAIVRAGFADISMIEEEEQSLAPTEVALEDLGEDGAKAVVELNRIEAEKGSDKGSITISLNSEDGESKGYNKEEF